MEQTSIKELLTQAGRSLKQETDYAKLTAAEKLSVLLSWVIGVLVAVLLCGCVLYFLAAALYQWLIAALGSVWGATGIVIVAIILVAALIFGYRKQLIVNPVTRFVTKLLLSPE